MRHNDSRESVIRSAQDPSLKQLLDMADFFISIGKKPRGKRQKTLTKDTATALYHTLNGLVDTSCKLLSTTHKYVLIGEHTSDPLEKEFGKLQQGSGGEYFLFQSYFFVSLDTVSILLLLSGFIVNIKLF